MPEYLAPGVYIEETSFRPKTIEGVSTSTTGFVGPTRFGPTEGTPELITSFNQFERIYGGLDPLQYEEPMANYLAHAVRAFFDNGGSRLYVARTFRNDEDETETDWGKAKSSVPTPVDVITKAYTAAENAVNASRKTVNEASNTSRLAMDTAIEVMRTALIHIMAALPGELDLTDIDVTALNLIDLVTEIEDSIDNLNIDQVEKDKATAALEQVQNQNVDFLARAIAVRDAYDPFNTGVSDLRDLLNAVINLGESDGNAAQLPDENNFENAVNTAQASTASAAAQKEAAVNAESGVIEKKNEMTAAKSALLLAQPDERVSCIENAVDAAEAAVSETATAIGAIVVDSGHAPAAAFAAVKDARIVQRAALKYKVGSIMARYPGQAGNLKTTFIPTLGENVLQGQPEKRITQVRKHDLISIKKGEEDAELFIAHRDESDNWSFSNAGNTLTLSDLDPTPGTGHAVQVCTLSLQIETPGEYPRSMFWADLTIHQERRRDGIMSLFSKLITNRTQELETPIVISVDSESPSETEMLALAEGLIGGDNLTALYDDNIAVKPNEFLLEGGDDGLRPSVEEYRGKEDDNTGVKTGLVSLEDLEEISIVAAPGLTFGAAESSDGINQTIQDLITHCEKMVYRVAVIDSGDEQGLSQVRKFRNKFDSKHAALYYPWVTIFDPITQQRLSTPPSGFVTGIYARNDFEHGVHKAPANEVPRGAIDLEYSINKAQQDVLNPIGINCLRHFENRGIRVWGARTISSDPEWKYLNLRRYFAYLERSIEKGTQWVVFENNGQRLWDNVRRTVEDFLFNEWKSGRLMGATTEEAYFVLCDRTTMTQNDWDNGRLICLIGVAPLRPAEFVIFRIGQKLLESKGLS